MTGQSLPLLTQARCFCMVVLTTGQGDEVASQRNKLVIGVLFVLLEVFIGLEFNPESENMSEGAVPITEEIEELKKKLALLGEP